ncbi:MAG: hypothetical protein HOE53_01635 [Candidatus Magasanikbacteria bacterium]|jgi:hypothetical protein|nr:hypothetical protein [Candidatus Magasanikbacteria bacterium]
MNTNKTGKGGDTGVVVLILGALVGLVLTVVSIAQQEQAEWSEDLASIHTVYAGFEPSAGPWQDMICDCDPALCLGIVDDSGAGGAPGDGGQDIVDSLDCDDGYLWTTSPAEFFFNPREWNDKSVMHYKHVLEPHRLDGWAGTLELSSLFFHDPEGTFVSYFFFLKRSGNQWVAVEENEAHPDLVLTEHNMGFDDLGRTFTLVHFGGEFVVAFDTNALAGVVAVASPNGNGNMTLHQQGQWSTSRDTNGTICMVH